MRKQRTDLMDDNWWCANGCGRYASKRNFPYGPPPNWKKLRRLGYVCPVCFRTHFRMGTS